MHVGDGNKVEGDKEGNGKSGKSNNDGNKKGNGNGGKSKGDGDEEGNCNKRRGQC